MWSFSGKIPLFGYGFNRTTNVWSALARRTPQHQFHTKMLEMAG